MTMDENWQVPAFELREFAPRRSRYCVCIPVINEGERLRRQLGRMRDLGLPGQADLLILDGGSSDGSVAPEVLQPLGVRALLIKTGPGRLGAQQRMGYAYALRQGYDGIVSLDGNDKDGVEAVPEFLRHLDLGFDLVQGSRYLPGGQAIHTPWTRHLAITLIHAPLASLASGFHYTDTTNAFRGYSRKLLLHPGVQPFREIFSRYELLVYLSIRAPRLGLRVTEIPVTRTYPAGSVPTKIGAVGGNFLLLATLLRAVAGAYNPKQG